MQRLAKLSLTLAIAVSVATGPERADAVDCNRDAMLVFDGSGSMAEMGFNGLDEPRIFEARDAVREVMPRVEAYRRIGLVVYGPGSGEACENVDLRFSPIPDAAASVIDEIDRLSPDGDTPLTQAVRRAIKTLGSGTAPGIVVLVTDGNENCGGQPCQLAAEVAALSNIVVHVIGFRVRSRAFRWQDAMETAPEGDETVARCLADRTGGTYVNAEGTDALVDALQKTLACPSFSALQLNGR